MRVYFDERCLLVGSLESVLRSWLQVSDIGQQAGGIDFFLDSGSTRNPAFLTRFNALRRDLQLLFGPLVFGVTCWRPGSIGANDYQLDSEAAPISDAGPCETLEQRLAGPHIALSGSEYSSYAPLTEVRIRRLTAPVAAETVACAYTEVEFIRRATTWGFLPPAYDLGSDRPPRDYETDLRKDPNRFHPLQRIDRNGRRRIYLEVESDRQFYVDNLHVGAAAHLEVFDANGEHLGEASLDGTLIPGTRVNGRRIEL